MSTDPLPQEPRMTSGSGSGMIERVARALALEDACDPDYVDTAGRIQWTYHVGAARAAISAMREPNQAILAAGGQYNQQRAGEIWRAQIDAALSPSRPKFTESET